MKKGDPEMGVGNYVLCITEEARIVTALFMMDSHHGLVNQKQMEWFANVALDVPSAGWTVTLCTHENLAKGLEFYAGEIITGILNAFKNQIERGQNELNGKLNDSDIANFCILDNDATEIINKAISSYNLSQRGINKTLKVARTIADLRDAKTISKVDIIESLSYRMKR
jgi:hypothetical protein